ncbi:MAG TPA: YidB family protein, partial [Beijerinckiaceae bacterium]|nr:YidB family protein [Beijerinckiaceae bacterium]
SWLSGGANMPITEAQLQAALSDQHVQALAQHFGIPTDAVLKLLSEHLPNAVQQAGQQGTVQAPAS